MDKAIIKMLEQMNQNADLLIFQVFTKNKDYLIFTETFAEENKTNDTEAEDGGNWHCWRIKKGKK